MRALLTILLASVLCSSHAQVNLNAGLIAYYPFNGNTTDASGNGNNAINFGATLTFDQLGNANSAYYFDGINDYMQITSNTALQLLPQMSLVAKVKIAGFYDGTCYGNCIIDRGGNDFIPGSFSLRFCSYYNNPSCLVFDSLHQNFGTLYNGLQPLPAVVSNIPYVQKDRWDCLVYTFDGTTHKLYVNAVLRYQYTGASATTTNTDNIFLGRKNSSTYPYWFKGIIDEVRIYNRALNIHETDSLCSLEAHLPDTSVTVSTVNNVPAAITTFHGTLAVAATVLPATVSQDVTWSVIQGTGDASVSNTGMVTAIANGTVWVKAISNIAPAYSDSLQVTITNQDTAANPNSISDMAKRTGFHLYPNPAHEVIYLQVKMQHPELMIVISDWNGKTVLTRKVPVNALNEPREFSLKSLPSGVYRLQVQGEGINIVKTYVKQ